MTYAANLNEEIVESQYLAVLKPRRFIQSAAFSLVSGTKYDAAFDYGQIVQVKNGADTLDEATSAALSDGDWYFDVDTETLTIDVGGAISDNQILATYEIYIATFDAHFHRVPNDDTTREVYFEPMIVKSPLLKDALNQSYFGVLSTLSSSITVSNATRFLQRHIYDSSFNNADINLYHWLGDLEPANVKLLLGGKMADITSGENEVMIGVYSANIIFQQSFRNQKTSGGVVTNFYRASVFAGLDPDFEGRPVRTVYGRVDGFVPVNIDYVKTSPTTSDNRTWICTATPATAARSDISSTVPASPSSTTTRTYFTTPLSGRFMIGDQVWLDSSAGAGFDFYVEVTAVGSNYIDHAAVGTAAASGSVLKRGFVARVDILRPDGSQFAAKFERDYVIYEDSTNRVIGFSFQTSAETNLGTTTFTPDDVMYCRVYGQKNDNTIGMSAFGTDQNTYGNLAQANVVMYDILKNHAGVPESLINTTSFNDADYTELVGFAIPESSNQEFPSYRDLFARLSLTMLTRFSLDDDNKWKLSRTEPAGSAVKIIEDDEILDKTAQFSFSYQDIITDVVVEYGYQEVFPKGGYSSPRYSSVVSSREYIKRLHDVESQKSFKSYSANSTEADSLADRLLAALGDRQGSLRIVTRHRFFDSEIGDVITIKRSRLPGFEFVDGIDSERDYVITSKEKSLNQITLELDDQKGVEDNAGDF